MRLIKYKRLESAARKLADRQGLIGRTGGWLYTKKGVRTVHHGYHAFGRAMLRHGFLLELEGGFVLAVDANRWEKERGKRARSPRPLPAWREAPA